MALPVSFIVGFALGFLLGVIATCVLLAKKNLERYNKISDHVENSFKDNYQAAKNFYEKQDKAKQRKKKRK